MTIKIEVNSIVDRNTFENTCKYFVRSSALTYIETIDKVHTYTLTSENPHDFFLMGIIVGDMQTKI